MAGFSKNKYDIYQSDMKSERDILMMMLDQKSKVVPREELKEELKEELRKDPRLPPR